VLCSGSGSHVQSRLGWSVTSRAGCAGGREAGSEVGVLKMTKSSKTTHARAGVGPDGECGDKGGSGGMLETLGKTATVKSYYAGWLGGGGDGDGQSRDAEREGEIAVSSRRGKSRGPQP
jgi:hypothetical protein